MPTSLIFAALTMSWLVILVPLVARRRQEVVRTGDVTLASRVLVRTQRGRERDEEMAVDSEGSQVVDEEIAHAGMERQYRPGRGGFDPEAAALAAQARYAFRQRVVVALVAGMLGTLLLALVSSAGYWWLQAGFDVALIGYLGYLRRQVRIEEQVRRRRAERQAGARPAAFESEPDRDGDEDDDGGGEVAATEPEAAPPPVALYPRATPLDLDDEAPDFDDLAAAYEPQYRRAAGE